MHEKYLTAIKSFEGYTPRAKWDYAQNSNGYGTKALYAGETIDRVEADRRFRVEIEQARRIVEKHAKGWDEGTKAALTSLTFNAGTRWTTGALGTAVRAFDVAAVEKSFAAYTRAGGDVLPGLVKRRLAELSWMERSNGPPMIPPMATDAGHTPAGNPAPQSTNAWSPVVAVSESAARADVEATVLRPAAALRRDSALIPEVAAAPNHSHAARLHALLASGIAMLPRDDASAIARKRRQPDRMQGWPLSRT